MGGNKWALEGYRLMDAQTVSSTMLAAQREEIAQVGYTLTPDQYRIYTPALASERTVNRTSAVLIEEATLRGDWATVAKITAPIVMQVESSGNPNAVGPVIKTGANKGDQARGSMQVMPKTMRDPGFGVRPVQAETAAEYARVGRDYWAAMVARHSGDVEAAAVAYNAGPANADKWLAAGRDYSVLPDQKQTQDYTQKVLGKLDNWRAPTAQDRYDDAKVILTETRERLALDVYEQVQPELAGIDDEFTRTGDRAKWKEDRAAVYDRYEVARTEADVNHEIAMIRSVDTAAAAAAKETSDTNYQLALERANAANTAPRLVWEAEMAREGITAEERRIANETYIASRNAAFEKEGIALADRGVGAVSEEIITSNVDAMKRRKVFDEEQVEINAATELGFLAELPTKLRERAMDQNEEALKRQFGEEVAENRMTEAEANDAMARARNAFFAEAGMVDPVVGRVASGMIMGDLINKDGTVNANAVDAVTQYAEIKAMNPRAVKGMLSPEAQNRADAILNRAGDAGFIGEAARSLGAELAGSPLIQDTTEYMARSDVQQRITRETTNYLETQDVGMWQGILQDDASTSQFFDRSRSATKAIWSEDMVSSVQAQIEAETSRLQKITPGIPARDLVATAAENVAARTQIIGEDLVHMPKGERFDVATFGERAAQFTQDGAVNSAIMTWLRSDEAKDQYNFLGQELTVAEKLPSWLKSTIDFGIGAIPFTDLEFPTTISDEDALSTARSGVRPFRVNPQVINGSVMVQVLKPDGSYSDHIAVPLRRAGEMHIKEFTRDMLKSNTRKDAVTSSPSP